MRLLAIGFLTATIGFAACTRENSVPVAAAPARALAPADRAETVVPTSGTAQPVTRAATTPAEAAAEPVGRSRAIAREVTVPAGTRLPVVLDESVGSDISRIEQPVHGHLSRAVVVRGTTVLPQGSRLNGVVTEATRSGKVKGRAHVAVRFDTIVPRGEDERYTLRTASVGRVAQGTKKRDALEIGLPAAGGAIIGGLLGGKKGAFIGGGAGGGAGTAVVLNQRGKEIHMPAGTPLTLRLAAPLTVRVRE